MTRQRPPERVEMITGDPRAFGAAPVPSVMSSAPSPTSPPNGHLSRVWIALGAVAVVALAVALVWPRSLRSAVIPVTTTVPAVTITTESAATDPQPTSPPGREAPLPVAASHIGLSITPTTAVLGRPVTVRLSGSLATTSPTLAAVVWVDHFGSGQWRTVAWIAQVGNDRQVENAVTEDGSSPGPDAVFLPPDRPFDVNVDALTSGLYRLCRYVPVHASDTPDTLDTFVPTIDIAYVCGELTIDHP